jgi:hypothetical protein
MDDVETAKIPKVITACGEIGGRGDYESIGLYFSRD